MGAVNDVPDHMLIEEAAFAEYLEESEPQAKVIPAPAYRDALHRMLFAPQSAERSATLPFAKAQGLIGLRPGEVSLWLGENGSGKSMLLSHCELGWMCDGGKVCELSFEMKPLRQLQRKARQYSRGPQPTPAAVDAMLDWLTDRMWFYDQQGTVAPRMVYAVARYAADRLRCDHIVIDSMMKCVRGEDDYNAQKDFVDTLCAIARDHGTHIHLVHHVRKPSADRTGPPSRYDAKGSGSISDQVDNVFAVWRNREKERAAELQERGEPLTPRQCELLDRPDALLACDKQRNGEWEGRIALWYDRGSMQYCADPHRRPTDFAAES